MSLETVLDFPECLKLCKLINMIEKRRVYQRQLFTARKRSLRKLCFYKCLSVILFTRGGGVCPKECWDTPLPRQTPSSPRQTPHKHYGIRSTSGQAGGRDIEIRSMSGWYASYWNAFLLSPYLVVSHAHPPFTTHAPLTMHAPLHHACPPLSCTPPATMQAPQ